MDFTENDFKQCLGSFVSGVTVVTMVDASNEVQGVTISSFSSLSLEPPMVSFNLGKASYLHSKMLNSDSFVVNILAEDQESLSRRFAERSDDRWNGVEYEKAMYGAPILKGVVGYIECLTDNIYEGGDHSIVTGLVKDVKTFKEKGPLVYFTGGYYMLGT